MPFDKETKNESKNLKRKLRGIAMKFPLKT